MRRALTRPRSNAAFTLVEVLATLALVAIILPVAMRGISLASGAAAEARRRMEAASLAEARLAELLATGDWQGTDLSGDFAPDWPLYRWRADVNDWEQGDLREITVYVEWTARGTERVVALTTLVYNGGQ
ncbi:MAG: type II secretion system protein [Planctomycetota bacterium]|jgi:prepilin-type N-terminal cleavage/methylation domain-containing protein